MQTKTFILDAINHDESFDSTVAKNVIKRNTPVSTYTRLNVSVAFTLQASSLWLRAHSPTSPTSAPARPSSLSQTQWPHKCPLPLEPSPEHHLPQHPPPLFLTSIYPSLSLLWACLELWISGEGVGGHWFHLWLFLWDVANNTELMLS